MNIKGIDNLLNTNLPAPSKSDKGSGFREIFDRTVSGINPSSPVKPLDPRIAVLDQGDKVLNMLDTYAGKLANASTSLKEIHPLVKEIENEVHRMESGAAGLGKESKDIGGFLRQVAVTANIAVLKFERGDYI